MNNLSLSVLVLLPFSGGVLGSRSLRNTAPAFFCIIMDMFSGSHSTWEVLKIAFNIGLAFGSVELKFHPLLAFIPIVLSSPAPRALRWDLWSRKSPGMTCNFLWMRPSLPHIWNGGLLFFPAPSGLFCFGVSTLGANATSSQSLIYHCSGEVTYFFFVWRYRFNFFVAHPSW